MKLEDFKSQLSMLLRDHPNGTTADLSDFAVAWWNGNDVTYAFLRDDETGLIEEVFDLDDYLWGEWRETLSKWVDAPKFSERAEVAGWLMDAPPYEAG
ncbi:hypothetical protein FVF58_42780 [Paraburkholderia panacisoli]|uniref:Uncharacterized protein n=1 Tax=Paraburkholderia panacisoli TaxID=2603818 RepID=A0A5B0G8W1_9BURK|nr:hypothetical protein [Paraburkholderia panacisoli]KAA0999041.1 hypothetical protein FVF58_42780 [Paraburkholderia panacisoli]